jgi:hypothetical protein
MKLLSKKIRNTTAIFIIVCLIYILSIIISIILYSNSVEGVKDFWEVIANITVVIGVISIFLSFWQNNLNEQEISKEKINSEIKLSEEMNRLDILDFQPMDNLNINQRLIDMINSAMEYLVKISLYDGEKIINIDRYLEFNLLNHKKIIYVLINLYDIILKTGDKSIIEKIDRNKRYLVKEIERLNNIDTEIQLLSQKIENIKKFNASNAIKSNIIVE